MSCRLRPKRRLRHTETQWYSHLKGTSFLFPQSEGGESVLEKWNSTAYIRWDTQKSPGLPSAITVFVAAFTFFRHFHGRESSVRLLRHFGRARWASAELRQRGACDRDCVAVRFTRWSCRACYGDEQRI